MAEEVIKNIKNEAPETKEVPAEPASPKDSSDKSGQASQGGEPKPKKKHTFLKILLLLLLLILLTVGGFFLYRYLVGGKTQETQNTEERFAGELSPRDPKVDESKKVTKAIGPAGGVLQLETEDALYTLTIPPETIILPKNVSLAPLTEVPFSGYERNDFGNGVFVGPDDNFLNKTAFLTIEKNGKKPEKEPGWDRCEIGSRGYSPEICAGENNFPFNYGVEAGKVSLFSNKERGLMFMQTIPSGEDSVASSRIIRGGAFLFDKLNKTETSQLAGEASENGKDLSTTVEPFAHLLSYGADLNPHKEKIHDLRRSKSSYPRALMETSMVAQAVGEKDVAKGKYEEFIKEYDQNFNFIRSAYLPWPEYHSTYHQISLMVEEKQTFLPKAHARRSRGNVGRNNAANAAAQAIINYGNADWHRLRKEEIERARGTLDDKRLSACEKLDAMEMLLVITMGASEADKAKMRDLIKEAVKCCSTKEQCQQAAKIAEKLFDSESKYNAEKKIDEMSKKPCTPSDSLTHKQGLSDYGYNEPCEESSGSSGSQNPQDVPRS